MHGEADVSVELKLTCLVSAIVDTQEQWRRYRVFIMLSYQGLGNEKWWCVDFCHLLCTLFEKVYFYGIICKQKTLKMNTHLFCGRVFTASVLITHIYFKYCNVHNNTLYWITGTFTLNAIKQFCRNGTFVHLFVKLQKNFQGKRDAFQLVVKVVPCLAFMALQIKRCCL